MATIYDVAIAAGVSPKTVSRVINGSKAVRPETRQKVRDAASALGFVPNMYARGMSARHTGVVGIYHCGSRFFSDALRLRTRILAGFEDTMAAAGYRLLLHSAIGRKDEENGMERLARDVDGVFVVGLPDGGERQQIAALLGRGFPLVCAGRRQIGSLEAYAAAPDNRGNVAAAIGYLVSQARERIGLALTSTAGEHNEDRCRGYIESLAHHGLPYEPRLLLLVGEGQDRESAALDWLAGTGADAVFAAEEDTALALARAARAQSRQMPQDLIIVTYVDSGGAGTMEPALVRMDRCDHEIGKEGARVLLRLIGGERVQPRTLLVKGRLGVALPVE
jgi:LacI family transcriptional regulator